MTEDGILRIAVAGLGYWGPNLARNFSAVRGADLAWCCDAAEANRERFAPLFPGARFTGDLDEVLADDTVDAVVLATPVPTHAALAVKSCAPASTASSRSRWRSRSPTPRPSSRRPARPGGR